MAVRATVGYFYEAGADKWCVTNLRRADDIFRDWAPIACRLVHFILLICVKFHTNAVSFTSAQLGRKAIFNVNLSCESSRSVLDRVVALYVFVFFFFCFFFLSST